ncbi:ATP synthase F0, A subunit [Catenulispora acidiphila DSM 44928]|uniref:ATP synthase subunit a n=1 Tax=Catenulispora acidiphila (strain DSM 44928 / JCM 14897 / NBRC 102108 / NRRL B-24433 / ID139908) TaxID=479433 RepID=C7Q749_CATAD|nr:F0F1 ATP synthase subunit A [Catenulispora acidiphila]ACU70137.1 ATP synthase F0, A subunit [Catenulispora acidiphila DSM 44928]
MSLSLASGTVLAADSGTGCGSGTPHLFGNNGGFSCVSPSSEDFDFASRPAFHIFGYGVTKPTLIVALIVVLMITFFWVAFNKPKMVPRGVQNVGEVAYLFVRDRIARDSMGKQGDKYVPFLFTLFFFVWLMNVMSFVPVVQFPVSSVYAFPLALAIMVWLTYMYAGFKRHGLGYFRVLGVPSGVPIGILVILTPIELLSNIFIRPFTLGIRLFANMFAGHLLLATFSAGAWYMFSVKGIVFSGASFTMAIVMTGFELFIQALQAYIFVMLTASYLQGALEEAH